MKNEYKRRLSIMKAAGYNVPLDGSWGPYQLLIWDKINTREKEYKPTVSNVHYSRTMTTDNLSKAANTVGEWVLTGLGKVGQVFNGLLTAGASTDFGLTSPFVMSSAKERRAIQRGRLAVLKKANEKIAQGMTWVSPLNYGVALWNGHGLNARKGEEEIASWSPAWLAVGRVGELYVGPKVVKGVKATPRVVVNTAAKSGNKTARAYLVSKELNKGIKLNTKNGRIEVTNTYFNSPDKWYRLSERPEKIGIEELGKNITTQDDPEIPGTIGNWRSTILDNRKGLNGKSKRIVPKPDNGFVLEEGMNFAKHGQAHGNTSQAAKGLIWDGTFAFSNRFPVGIIEGQAPNKIFRGMTAEGKDSRSNFVLLDWEDVPIGSRVGFHTGEMPMSNLGWFLRTNKGTYTYEPIIPEKRIEIKPSTKLLRVISEGTYPWYRGRLHSVKEVVNPDGTINPRQAMRILHEVSELFPGSYKMEHRLENKEYHPTDPTTYNHTKNVAQSAWGLDVPYGFTKHDLMVAAVGHDFGKMVAGDGHAQIGADLAKQVFPDLTDAQYTAIAEHMGSPKTLLGKATKMADMRNGIVVRNINGKTRIQLPTHTDTKPREIVLDPQGNNKYYIHMRVWDDVENHIPGNISNVEKSNLFQTLYETLPDGAEILFPKSGPEHYGTRGTVAGLLRLSRDSRFQPGTPGTLYYKGKNNEVQTYQGTSFIKKPLFGFEGYPYAYEGTLSMDDVQGFINNDIIPRLRELGHQIESYTPNVRSADFKNDLFDLKMRRENGGAWFSPSTNDITLRGPLENLSFDLVLHETGGHGIRYNMQPDYKPVSREVVNDYLTNIYDPVKQLPLLEAHIGKEVFNDFEATTLGDAYPEVAGYFEGYINGLSGKKLPPEMVTLRILDELGAINTQFRAKLSENGRLTGKALNKKIQLTPEGVILRMEIEQGYTSMGILERISKITGLSMDELNFYNPASLQKLVEKFPELKTITDKVKYAMTHVAVGAGVMYGLNQYGMVELKKKGGKTHRPFGHRSILDNGWQSTKLLKNKKNVYGK